MRLSSGQENYLFKEPLYAEFFLRDRVLNLEFCYCGLDFLASAAPILEVKREEVPREIRTRFIWIRCLMV